MKKRNEENYVKHTYKFYKDRKNDPKWRPSYLKARQQRIIWIVIGTAFILLISSISFFAYSYSNAGKHTPTESFNKSSDQSSSTSKTSSSSKSSSSSSQKTLRNMDNLDLNTKIAILSQAYSVLNPSTTILQASNLAMSNSWDNGPIEWYDAQGSRHKLDVRVTGDTITYSYVDPNTGQPTTQTASVNESLDRFYSLKSNMESTQAIANKCVAPADLKPNDGAHDGGHVPDNYNDISSMKDSSTLFFEKNDIQNITSKQLLDPIFQAAHGDVSQFFGTYTSEKDGYQIKILNDSNAKNYYPTISFFNPTGTGVGSDNTLTEAIAAGKLSPGHLGVITDFIEYNFKNAQGKQGVICLTATTSPQSGNIDLSIVTFVDNERINYVKN